MIKKKRKGPPEHLTTNPELEAKGKRAREQFRAAVDAIPLEVKEEIFENFQKTTQTLPVEDKEEINILKKEQEKEEQFWKGYSNKFKNQVYSEDIFEEVKNFEKIKTKEKNNFFNKILKILGF
jgi:hypothetical protein